MVYTVRVKYSTGAYVTSTVNGRRASSTMSAEQAVRTIAHKLVTDRPASVRLVERAADGVETWEIEA